MQKLLNLPRVPLILGLILVLVLVAASVLHLTWDWRDAWDDLFGARSEQNWTKRQQTWFYNTTQGSQLIDYKWMLNLEQPDNENPFLADEHMDQLRYITRNFDPNERDRVDHLPVGFAKDVSEDGSKKVWLGLTCAACHTNELEYKGEKIRIDGGGTLANGALLTARLTESVTNTYISDEKFGRFSVGVLGDSASETSINDLRNDLRDYMEVRQEYEHRNADSTATIEGYGRFDAFGRIFNRALHLDGAEALNFNPIDAPVSYPFLWGTNQSDWVQWVGSTGNGGIGPLARNTGEVLGVFASLNINPPPRTLGYPNSAKSFNQIDLEDRIRKLRSPVWPEGILPDIDEEKAARGAGLYKGNCAVCHNIVDRIDEKRKVIAWMEGLDTVGTDPTTALNIAGPKARRGKTGDLEGLRMEPLSTRIFGPTAAVTAILANEVTGMLAQRKRALAKQELIALRQGRPGFSKETDKQGNFDKKHPLLAYKGRSLNGVWATAPFLHNGSVPTLWELLTKPEDRVKEFYVGSREFDPVNVGIKPDSEPPFSYKFRTEDAAGNPITGNSNAGHIWGTQLTPDQKWDLIEYMKTDMGPAQ